jgi:cell division protein FtsW
MAKDSPATLLEHRMLLIAVGSLCLLGLPIVLSASAVVSISGGASAYSLFLHQAIFMAVGLVAAIVASRLRMEVLRKLRLILPYGTLLLLLVVYMPGVGHQAGGSSRWIGFGPIQVQPSELMKLGIIVFAADLLARRAGRDDTARTVVQPLMILLGVAAILIVKQPDLGTSIVISCIVFALMFAAGIRGRTLAVWGALVGAAGAYLALGAAYRRDRLLSFVHPFAHASTSGYQVAQALITLGQGRLLGNGVGGSLSTWGYLPNAHTDFIFAVIGGNLGVFGTVAVLGCFGAFGWAGFRVAAREHDPFTRYVAVGITSWIICQAVINIGGVVDALPVTGIPLPFVSYGGTALVLTLAGSGLLLGIARRQAVT